MVSCMEISHNCCTLFATLHLVTKWHKNICPSSVAIFTKFFSTKKIFLSFKIFTYVTLWIKRCRFHPNLLDLIIKVVQKSLNQTKLITTSKLKRKYIYLKVRLIPNFKEMENPEKEIKASSNLKVYWLQIITSYTICTNLEKKKKLYLHCHHKGRDLFRLQNLKKRDKKGVTCEKREN